MNLRPVDLAVEARWILGAQETQGLLEHHALIVHEGRIRDLLPAVQARTRYAPTALIQRPAHLLLPGLVHGRLAFDAAPGAARSACDSALLGIAQLLRAGVTTFAHVGRHARIVAQSALEQGLRVCLGVPVAAPASLSEALEVHDIYRAHPSVVTRFALPDTRTLDEALLARIGTLSVEIDAGVLAPLHATRREIDDSVRLHGARPLARLDRHGLLTPMLAAAHLTYLDADDLELARRCAIGVTLCPRSDALAGEGPAPLAELAASGLRLSIGHGWREGDAAREGHGPARRLSPWPDLEWLAGAAPRTFTATGALALATRAGARVLGFEEVGMLAPGAWADLACFPLTPLEALAAADPLEGVLLGPAQPVASDVWVAGRQLICEGVFMRLDVATLLARLGAAPNGGAA
jgi:5-methylthioadenosine/S-adenosylhomocysteine deaminase